MTAAILPFAHAHPRPSAHPLRRRNLQTVVSVIADSVAVRDRSQPVVTA